MECRKTSQADSVATNAQPPPAPWVAVTSSDIGSLADGAVRGVGMFFLVIRRTLLPMRRAEAGTGGLRRLLGRSVELG